MCAHSSSGEEITRKISEKLYPFIAGLFEEAVGYIHKNASCEEASDLYEHLYTLRAEFESLRNYELKLVFPSVLKVFNTKDKPELKPTLNIEELQRLTQNKEKAIINLVEEMELEAEAIRLGKQHPIYPLLFVFQTAFVSEKAEWNSMLSNWSTGCACFIAANSWAKETGNQS